MTIISNWVDELKESHNLELHSHLGPCPPGEFSDVYLGRYKGRPCIVKISRDKHHAGAPPKELTIKHNVLKSIENLSDEFPDSFVSLYYWLPNFHGSLLSCWEYFEKSLEHLISECSSGFSRPHCIDMLEPVVIALKHWRKSDSRVSGFLTPGACFIDSRHSTIKIGDLGRTLSNAEKNIYVPTKSDWRYQHKARDVYAVCMLYLRLRTAGLEAALGYWKKLALSRIEQPQELAERISDFSGLDPEERSLIEQTLDSTNKGRIELEDPIRWLSILAGRDLDPEETRNKDVSKSFSREIFCHWFRDTNSLRIIRMGESANSCSVWVRTSPESTLKNLGELRALDHIFETELPTGCQSEFELILKGEFGTSFFSQRFVMGPELNCKSSGLRVSWEAETCWAVFVDSFDDEADSWSSDRITGVCSGNFRHTASLERRARECFLTPEYSDGTRGQTEVVLVGPAIQRIEVTFEHLEEADYGQYMSLLIDCSACAKPPKTVIEHRQFSSPDSTDGFHEIVWEEKRARIILRDIETKDRINVVFQENTQVDCVTRVKHGDCIERLEEPNYTFFQR